jgi:hypothetical protein
MFVKWVQKTGNPKEIIESFSVHISDVEADKIDDVCFIQYIERQIVYLMRCRFFLL